MTIDLPTIIVISIMVLIVLWVIKGPDNDLDDTGPNCKRGWLVEHLKKIPCIDAVVKNNESKLTQLVNTTWESIGKDIRKVHSTTFITKNNDQPFLEFTDSRPFDIQQFIKAVDECRYLKIILIFTTVLFPNKKYIIRLDFYRKESQGRTSLQLDTSSLQLYLG